MPELWEPGITRWRVFLPEDRNHEVAVKAAKELQGEHKDILIPAAVLVEFLNILGRKAGHQAALAAVSELTPPFLVLHEQIMFPKH